MYDVEEREAVSRGASLRTGVEPGDSDPVKMLTLCLPSHAKVSRTLYVQDDWPEFLRVLWREQHPDGREQVALNFTVGSSLGEECSPDQRDGPVDVAQRKQRRVSN
jgi:hypothetical protein